MPRNKLSDKDKIELANFMNHVEISEQRRRADRFVERVAKKAQRQRRPRKPKPKSKYRQNELVKIVSIGGVPVED